jgi:hypothetical protein
MRYAGIVTWWVLLVLLLVIITAPFVLSSMCRTSTRLTYNGGPGHEVHRFGVPDTFVTVTRVPFSLQIHWALVGNVLALAGGWTAIVLTMILLKRRRFSLRSAMLFITSIAILLALGRNTLLFWAIFLAAIHRGDL